MRTQPRRPRVEFAGITPHAKAVSSKIERNLTVPIDGFLRDHLVVICDRGTKFTEHLKTVLGDAGVEVATSRVRFTTKTD